MRKVKNLVVGCGLSGVVLAERLASQMNEEVLIIERRNHIGGNIFDYKDETTGITVHKYGPHVFHTNNQEVWDYVSQFTDWHYFMYHVKAVIDGIEVNIPFNLNSLYKVFPNALASALENKLLSEFFFNTKISILELLRLHDKDLEFLSKYIYEKVFLGYTIKQWGVKPEELDPSVSSRVPIYISRDDRYFQDKYQAIPQNGYTAMIKNILNNELITVELNTDFNRIRNDIKYDRLFFTGAIDEFFNYELGHLPYRSLNIVLKTINREFYQSGPQINYPENYDFTRSVEYKYYLDEKSDKTIVSYEFPCSYEINRNEPFYPVPNDKNTELYVRYKNKAKQLHNVSFIGRLANYVYINMDVAIYEALKLIKTIMERGL